MFIIVISSLPMFTTIYSCLLTYGYWYLFGLPMFTPDYICLPLFNHVYMCLPCVSLFTTVYSCTFTFLPLFTQFYLCLHLLIYVYHCFARIYICWPQFTRVIFTYIYPCLLGFTCLLLLSIFTTVYSFLPMFNTDIGLVITFKQAHKW